MENQTKPNTRTLLAHCPLTNDEREVVKILRNLSSLIRKRSSSGLPDWGCRGKRSDVDLKTSQLRNKENRVSPETIIAFPPSETEDKTLQLSLQVQPMPKNKLPTKGQLLEKINQLTPIKEALTKELEKVKDHHNKLRTYNNVLKTKQQELNQRKANGERKKSMNITIEVAQDKTPIPFQLDHRNIFLRYSYNQPRLNSPSCGVPDLNLICDENREEVFGMEYSQSSNQTVQANGVGRKKRAAEARKRRMITIRERKLKC